MKSLIVVGLQWGDEGKGKIIDALAKSFRYVVRWNGGNNAGHTVVVGKNKFPLSLIPSGVVQKRKLLIAQGVVIAPEVLLREIDSFKEKGFPVKLTIDPRCHIVMPYHKLFDKATELWKGKLATGSLHLGIGYCYEDRNNRAGIRLEDLVRPEVLEQKLSIILPLKLAILRNAFNLQADLTVDEIVKEFVAYGRKLKPFMGDVSQLVSRSIDRESFLFEQAHGTLLDPVFGTYPFTVAPPTLATATFTSVGIPVRQFPVLGVVKAYTTRVGNGPFPTELHDALGETIRQKGGEFGTVSKRPRRCGWLDIPLLRHAVRINGCTSLAVTKLDVLSGLSELQICTSYRCRGRVLKEFPAEVNDLPDCSPVYRRFAGWQEDISMVRQYKDLPVTARTYLKFLETQLGVPIHYISVGAERRSIVCRDKHVPFRLD